MYVNEKEFEALHAAIDFVEANAEGADPENYPHEMIKGLYSLFKKMKKDRDSRLIKCVSKAMINNVLKGDL